MKYVFQFSFSFDEDRERSSAFMLNETALAKLGITSPSAHCLPESHLDWMGRVTENIEARFGVVHDFSGTEDEDTLIEGFTTYEALPETATEIMAVWRAAFAERLHGEEGVSAVVSCDSTEDHPSAWEDMSLTATSIAELVEAKLMETPRVAPTARAKAALR